MYQVHRRAVLAFAALSASVLPALARTTHAGEALDGQLATALDRLDGLVADAMARSGIPGVAVAVVYQDKVVHLKGYGVREAGTSKMVDADTVFQLASVSKPVASTEREEAPGLAQSPRDGQPIASRLSVHGRRPLFS